MTTWPRFATRRRWPSSPWTNDGRPGRAVLNYLWLALAYQQLGKPDEARRWLEKATYWLDQQGGLMPVESQFMGSHRHNWLEAHVLRQQAEARLP